MQLTWRQRCVSSKLNAIFIDTKSTFVAHERVHIAVGGRGVNWIEKSSENVIYFTLLPLPPLHSSLLFIFLFIYLFLFFQFSFSNLLWFLIKFLLFSFRFFSVTECQFGKVLRELGSTWYADLGPPFGVMYCIKCECVAVSQASELFLDLSWVSLSYFRRGFK